MQGVDLLRRTCDLPSTLILSILQSDLFSFKSFSTVIRVHFASITCRTYVTARAFAREVYLSIVKPMRPFLLLAHEM